MMNKTHRARREHEILVDRLRRWAMFRNVDAVIWIDYAKTNQPPGSFKMGPRDSRPFHACHMEVCANGVLGGKGKNDHDGDESEAMWSDEEDPGLAPAYGHDFSLSGPGRTGEPMSVLARGSTKGGFAVVRRKFRTNSIMSATTGGADALGRSDSIVKLGGTAGSIAAGIPGAASTGGSFRQGDTSGGSFSAREPRDSTQLPSSLEDSLVWRGTIPPEETERRLLRSMIQDEVIPKYGSIYKRSITPGPGYYALRKAPDDLEIYQERQNIGLGRKREGIIDKVIAAASKLPGPGDYQAKPAMAEVKHPFGSFDRAERSALPTEAHRKLPFISVAASKADGMASTALGFSILWNQTPERCVHLATLSAKHPGPFDGQPSSAA
eukprot:CAMPEP_0172755428 /NCGR_PEP_ID=MMETSP1074-20121228/159809_1 /TAXON_ID=2916 /ORGANISM="Ceratium fusus, Strain PA161109" /LENGTH=380 /DNA_ID=CAMNT_0013588509 /DNA_START=188 /DNA_END=1328 /DNA_ORIENTATION=+